MALFKAFNLGSSEMGTIQGKTQPAIPTPKISERLKPLFVAFYVTILICICPQIPNA